MQFDQLTNLPQTCRHDRIVEMICERGFLTTEELVATFRVIPIKLSNPVMSMAS